MEDRSRPRYNPTPEEIAEGCRKIREGWSDERWSREKAKEWQIPEVSAKKLPPHGHS
jgi:hypothetical protein